MASLDILIAVLVTVGVAILCAALFKKWRHCMEVKKLQESRLKWKKEHRNTLTGNFVMTYSTPISDTYDIQSSALLGKGTFGVVVVGYHKESKVQYAIKLVNTSSGKRKRIEREYKLLKDIDHPNIVRLFAVYDTPSEVGFVMELCTGGSVSSWIERLQYSSKKGLPEATVKNTIRQLMSAIAHMHTRGICHRDIKLQNIMREHAGWNAQIKLIDFGLGTRFIGATPMKTRCGTLYATAPEVLRESYDERCDVWSAGVVTYTLLTGRKPFEALLLGGDNSDGKCSVMTNILMGRCNYRNKDWKKLSNDAFDFTRGLLTHDYKDRWSAQEALKHPWLDDNRSIGHENSDDEVSDTEEREKEATARTRRFSSASVMSDSSVVLADSPNCSSPLTPNALLNLKRQKDVSVLHSTSMMAMAYNMPLDKAVDRRAFFQSFDQDNNGTLSREEFRQAMLACNPPNCSEQLSSNDIDSIFSAVDVNGDNQISFTEFLAATLDPRDFDIQSINTAFHLLDTDNKGYITFNDMERVLSVTSAARKRSVLMSQTNTRSDSRKHIYQPSSSSKALGHDDSDEFSGDKAGYPSSTQAAARIRGRSHSLGNIFKRSNAVIDVLPSASQRRFSLTNAPLSPLVSLGISSCSGDSQHSNNEIKIHRRKTSSILPILSSKSSPMMLYSKSITNKPPPELDSTTAEQIQKAMKLFDKTGDGVVSYADFLLALTDNGTPYYKPDVESADATSSNVYPVGRESSSMYSRTNSGSKRCGSRDIVRAQSAVYLTKHEERSQSSISGEAIS